MEKIFGRTEGLKKSELRKLSNLYRRRVPAERVLTPELAQTLALLSQEVGRPLSLLLDREGRVVRVGVGDAKELPIPEGARAENRLSGFRLLHTHLAKGGLSRPDLSVLFLHRLDNLAALEVEEGRPTTLHLAFLSPPKAEEEDWRILPPRPYFQYLELDLKAEVAALEEEMARQARVHELRDGSGERAILVGVDLGEGPEAEAALGELAELTRTAGGVPVRQVLVFRQALDPRYLVGLGKLEELKSLAYHENASTLIFGLELSPAQAREIEKATGLKVLDRTQLILDIFALHAKTPEAQAQVELAQLRYLLPRLVGKGKELSRLGGGIGTRGPGETKLEVDRRRLLARVAHLSRKLEEYAKRREEARRQRKRRGVPLVAVVGYTNAGKTTLLQALARGGEPGEDKLFATLRPLTRRGFLPGVGEVLFTDTVGFIRRMPEELLTAFRATLEEVREADLLVHVLDASEEGALGRHQVVEGLLRELGVEAPRVLALAKADRAAPYDLLYLRERLGGVPVSALKGTGLAELKEALAQALLQAGVRPQAWAQYT
ncbi:MAG: GTPase HflX [Thermus sp.]|uniref:GTPase HflX n=1 Tax=unclassified Thermus TaxID=2619321 RepID=UPI00023899D4|nr:MULTISPECIES: GTPase HflX [unclassified Thermus]AEV15928.1 GTP-binding protein, HSR1-related protein [Thermus sp. CCB_US3_UF1]MCS6869518.1 GTPase HflX [Thermus sp.]MCS7218017.1 GTPase HflX [Thermus sp.]MCX7850729.1 GTPase HflX [Thermus sp.]MDW8018357.1 GTPase HflX [Thermus sp.]